MADPVTILRGPLRALLRDKFSFRDIKMVFGIAGVDLSRLAHLRQAPSGGAAKIDLIEALDEIYAERDDESKQRFLTALTEEILRRRPDLAQQLRNYFSRLGWSFVEGQALPLAFIDPADLQHIPETAHEDLLKSAARFRDGDLSGVVTAACGAVD